MGIMGLNSDSCRTLHPSIKARSLEALCMLLVPFPRLHFILPSNGTDVTSLPFNPLLDNIDLNINPLTAALIIEDGAQLEGSHPRVEKVHIPPRGLGFTLLMNDGGFHPVLKSFVSEFPEEFTAFDMENLEFQEAEANLNDLISEYDQYQENWNPGWGQRTFAHWLIGSGLDENQI